MLPFSFSGKGDKAAADMEGELDRFVASGMKQSKTVIRKPTVTSHHEDNKAQAAAKPASMPKTQKASGWMVKPHVSKKGVTGRIVKVGPFSAWLPDGDADKRQAAADAINKVFRTEEVNRLWAAVTAP